MFDKPTIKLLFFTILIDYIQKNWYINYNNSKSYECAIYIGKHHVLMSQISDW